MNGLMLLLALAAPTAPDYDLIGQALDRIEAKVDKVVGQLAGDDGRPWTIAYATKGDVEVITVRDQEGRQRTFERPVRSTSGQAPATRTPAARAPAARTPTPVRFVNYQAEQPAEAYTYPAAPTYTYAAQPAMTYPVTQAAAPTYTYAAQPAMTYPAATTYRQGGFFSGIFGGSQGGCSSGQCR